MFDEAVALAATRHFGSTWSQIKVIRPFVAVVLWYLLSVGCVTTSTRRAYEQHMVQAEACKVAFDQQVPLGTPLDEVKQYLQAQGRRISNAVGERGTGEVLVELFRGKSIHWYCGKASVGLSLRFVENKLTGTRVSSWSVDCL